MLKIIIFSNLINSTVVAWALSKTNNRGMPAFNDLYAAAMDGAQGLNCVVKY